MEIQTYVKRSCTKQQGGFDKFLKPHKELRARIDSHVSSPSNGGPSEEVSTPVGQTVDTTKAGSKGSKALVKAANDFALTTTPTAVKRRCKNPELSAPVVLGLRCKAMTVPKNKNSKQLVAASVVGEPGPSQSGVPLVSKTTDKQVNQVVETDGETSATRRWEPAFKRDANRKTLLPSKLKIYDVNEDASVNKSPDRMGLELALRQVESNKPVKGKRGRGRRISLNMEPSPRVSVDLQASRAQEDNGNSENLVEKSLNMEPDDQPINILVQASKESAGKERRLEFPPSVTKNKDQNSCSEKKSAFWKSIETMEAFRIFPQNPHFRPLNNLNVSACEHSAIHKMINFSTVFEDTCRLRQNDPRTKIEEKLEVLLELETHGFDVGLLRSRLKEMLSLKDKAETHRTDVKEPRDKIRSERAKIQERNRLITIIDRQSDELCEKPALLERKVRARREQLMRENEESELKIDSWEELVDDHERAIGECDRRIKELATAPF